MHWSNVFNRPLACIYYRPIVIENVDLRGMFGLSTCGRPKMQGMRGFIDRGFVYVAPSTVVSLNNFQTSITDLPVEKLCLHSVPNRSLSSRSYFYVRNKMSFV